MPNSDYPSSPGQSQSGGVIPPKAEETLRHDAEALVETAKTDFDKVKQEAAEQAGELAETAKAQISDVAEKAKGLASEQKELLAGQIGGMADAMERVAADLEAENASSASYARMIADGATRLSETVKNNDVDAIFNMAQDFGRKQPAAFLGAAALLGFAASRFLLASAKREDQRASQPHNGSAVDYNGTPDFATTQQSYGASSGSDYPSDGRI